jgi:hypothetical protein
MATSPVKLQQGYGIGNALQNLSPFSIIANRVPTQSDKARIGTFWIYTGANNVYVLSSVTGGLSNWLTLSNGGAGVFSNLTVNGFITQTAGVTSLLATTTTGLTNTGVFNQIGDISVNACPVVGALSIVENLHTTVIYTESNRLGGSRHLLCRQTSIDGSPVYFTTVKSRNGAIVNDTDILFQQNIVARGDTNESESARIVFTAGPPVLTTAQVPSSMAIVTTDLAGTGANRLTISTNGAINMPTQPCFSACRFGAAQVNVTGNGLNTDCLFDLILLNTGTVYNAANGRFTASTAGRYYFTVAINVGVITDAGMTSGELYLNRYNSLNVIQSNNVFQSCNPYAGRYAPGVGDYFGFQGNVILECSVGDYVVVGAVVRGGAGDSCTYTGLDRKCIFSGTLLS